MTKFGAAENEMERLTAKFAQRTPTEHSLLWIQTIVFFFPPGTLPNPIQWCSGTHILHFSSEHHWTPRLFFFFFLLKQNYKIIFLTTNLYKLDGDDFLKMIYIKHVLWLWNLSILCKLDQLSFHAFLGGGWAGSAGGGRISRQDQFPSAVLLLPLLATVSSLYCHLFLLLLTLPPSPTLHTISNRGPQERSSGFYL